MVEPAGRARDAVHEADRRVSKSAAGARSLQIQHGFRVSVDAVAVAPTTASVRRPYPACLDWS